MKRLFILRHAKSSWAQSELSDFDRPLNDRGVAAASFMGKFITRTGFAPAAILCSPAVRARSTAELVVAAGDIAADIQYDERIYEASPQSLRQVASEIDGRYDSAMMIGHNPGIEGFIRFLTGEIQPMPTAALAVIDLDIDKWHEIDADRGKLVDIYRPKAEMART